MKNFEILEVLEYILQNKIIGLLEEQEHVSNLLSLDYKDSLIKASIQEAKNEEGLQCDKLEERQYYIKLSKKYDKILNNAIDEYKKDLIAKAEEEQRQFLESPEGRKWQHKQEVKKAWKEVKESWQPAKKQLANGAINAGIVAGSFFRVLAKNSKPRKNSIFK